MSCAWQLARRDPGSESSRALAAYLDSEAGGSVLAKDLARPDIAPQRRNGLVPRLTHDDELADAVHRGLSHAACPERMPTEFVDLQSRPHRCTLQKLADRILVQAAPRNMTVSLNGPEDRAFSNPGPVEPLAQRTDGTRILTGSEGQAYVSSGALLVCLRLANADDDAIDGELEVTYIDGGQLRAPKSSRKSGQHQCGVSNPEKVSAPGGDDPADVWERGLSVLCGADGAPYALERLSHDKMAGRSRRVGEARGLIRLGDRGTGFTCGCREGLHAG